MTGPQRFDDIEACADALVERLSGRIRLAVPLGLGKPVRLINALYHRARENPDVELRIYTALTLEIPRARSDLEGRLLDGLVERLYGRVPELTYAVDRRRGALPANVHIEEFYLRPGAFLGAPVTQQSYVSSNYSHVPRDLVARGVNVVAQMVAPAPAPDTGRVFSLSCNPDLTRDLMDCARAAGVAAPLLVGEVNPSLPFMPRSAEVPAAEFDLLLQAGDTCYDLFPVPNRPVSLAEQIIGLRVAALTKDGGTLQVGIGSLGDGIAHALGLRHVDHAGYLALLAALSIDAPAEGLDDLPNGLYGASEMFGEGFLHLRDQGVLRRTVDDGVYLHGGFLLGSARFYERLRRLSEEDRRGIDMTRISFTNQLYGDEQRKREHRRDARFVNTAMMVTLLGATVSDGLEDGRVVSGVGGQFNFVAMAHELAGARSIITLPATRLAKGRLSSNLVWQYGHVTIPRHLRDVVVTEYGVAELRGRSDREVIAALLNVADSRFQEGLRQRAVAAGKLPETYRIPQRHRSNTPQALQQALAGAGLLALLPHFPLGTDFTPEEAALSLALGALAEQQHDRRALLQRLWRVAVVAGWRLAGTPQTATAPDTATATALARLGLDRPRGVRQHLYRALVVSALWEQVHDAGRPLFR